MENLNDDTSIVVMYVRSLRSFGVPHLLIPSQTRSHLVTSCLVVVGIAVAWKATVGPAMEQWSMGFWFLVIGLACLGGLSVGDGSLKHMAWRQGQYMRYLGFSSRSLRRLVRLVFSPEVMVWMICLVVLVWSYRPWWELALGVAIIGLATGWVAPFFSQVLSDKRSQVSRNPSPDNIRRRLLPRQQAWAVFIKDASVVGIFRMTMSLLASLALALLPVLLVEQITPLIAFSLSIFIMAYGGAYSLCISETGVSAAYFRQWYGLSYRKTAAQKNAPLVVLLLLQLGISSSLALYIGLDIVVVLPVALVVMPLGLVVGWCCLWCFLHIIKSTGSLDDLPCILIAFSLFIPGLVFILGLRAWTVFSKEEKLYANH